MKIKPQRDRRKLLAREKPPRKEGRPGWMKPRRCNKYRLFKNGLIEITCVFVIQTVGGAEDAVRTEGHHHQRDHEGDRLAATFGPRLPCRRGEEEARPQSCLREARRPTHLPDRQIWHGAMMVMQQTAPAQTTDPAVEDELDRLVVMPIAQLRVRYREVLRTNPPKAFGPDLLRRSIAHRIQEKAYGGLSRSAER